MQKENQVYCNQCGKKMFVKNEIIREGCFHAEARFGYFSRKDGVKQRWDLCEDCYDRLIRSFTIPVEEEEERELL